ncbi:MAG: hypothetical protein ABIL58_23515 [Pseudomonadota bacterium]
MNQKDEKIVMYDSPEAAKQGKKLLFGWWSRKGRYYAPGKEAEHMARWDGCTHRRCDCGEIMERMWTKCAKCREKAEVERHAARETAEWDGKGPIYSETIDRFFMGWSEVEDYCVDQDPPVAYKDLRLLACQPIMAQPIDPFDYYGDNLPEEDDGSLPHEIVMAFKRLNEEIRACTTPLAWEPSKIAVRIGES